MNIFGTLQNAVATNFLKTEPMLIDLGSSYTRISLGKKEVFNQPTCLAVHTGTQSVVAFGDEALKLLGKAPHLIEISFPVQHGVVAHTKYLELYLSSAIDEIFPKAQLQRYLFGLRAKVAIPATTSPAKKELLTRVLKNVGISSLELVTSSSVIVQNLVKSDANMQDICIIDIGSLKTEISIFSSGELVKSKLFRWGGVNLTECLQKIIRSKHKCVVGWYVAEATKKEIGTVLSSKDKVAVQGKDLVSQASKNVIVDAGDVKKDFIEQLDELLDFIQQFFALLPSEIAISVLQKGLYITGGSSQLQGIDQVFIDRFKCDVLVSQNPSGDVSIGLQKIYS